MNEIPTSPKRRRWRLRIGLAIVVVLCLCDGVYWMYFVPPALSAEEQKLVGVWRSNCKGVVIAGTICECEFRTDRTTANRLINPKSGAVVMEIDSFSWAIVDGKLIFYRRSLNAVMSARQGKIPFARETIESVITWDNPNQFTQQYIYTPPRSTAPITWVRFHS